MALRRTASSAGDEENANMLSLAPVAAPPLPLPLPLSPHAAVTSMRASAPAMAVAFRIRNIGSAPWGYVGYRCGISACFGRDGRAAPGQLRHVAWPHAVNGRIQARYPTIYVAHPGDPWTPPRRDHPPETGANPALDART